MKYPYLVIHDGVEYPAGTEVPNDTTPIRENKKVVVEEVKEEIKAEEKSVAETKKYTKTDINRMSIDELKKLSKENGVKGSSGAELKKELIKKFGL